MPLPPPWLELQTKNVISSFMRALRLHSDWQTIYIVSPWISSFEDPSMSYDDFLWRLTLFRTHAFVATRPPQHDWHRDALDRLKRTGRANIVLIDTLHTKLYCVQSPSAWIALTGSANFTKKSMSNIEFGVTINNKGEGTRLVVDLIRHATDIYRSPARTIFCRSKPFAT